MDIKRERIVLPVSFNLNFSLNLQIPNNSCDLVYLMMTDEECKELGIMTETELKEMGQRLDAIQIVGLADLVKYFDRINDKLFQLNNMIIAGYFALIVIKPNTSSWLILVPIINFFLLLFVDWQMMEKSRLESNVKSISPIEIDRLGNLVEKSNIYSLMTIITTVIVTVIFTYLIIHK